MDKDRPSEPARCPSPKASQAEIVGRQEAEAELRLLLAVTRAIAEAQDFHSAARDGPTAHLANRPGGTMARFGFPTLTIMSSRFEVAWHRENEDLDRFRSFSESLRFAPGLGLPGRVWQTKQSKVATRILQSRQREEFARREIAKTFNLKSALGIPVIGADKVTAVLGFLMFDSRPEDKRLIEMVSHVAAQLGALIQRRRAEEELREGARRTRSAG